MAKDTFYFSHDYNSRSDEKIKRLIRKHGMLGYGVFWAIIEDLYNNANEMQLDCEGIAYEYRIDESVAKSIINNFDLFVINDETFGSLSVQKRLEERNAKSSKARKSALKRWNKEANAEETQCEGIKDECECNAIKERKGKERKVNKENKIEGKPLSTPKKTLQELCLERETKFKEDVLAFSQYDETMLNAFFLYWSEPNKSKSKMLWETKPTFEIKRRLVTWASKQFNNTQRNGLTTTKETRTEAAERKLLEDFANLGNGN